MATEMNVRSTAPGPDLAAVKERQQQVWASGDYDRVATFITMTSELLCESVDVHPGWRALDVATGSGNTAIAAARRFCKVTGIDYVPALIERAKAERRRHSPGSGRGTPLARPACIAPMQPRRGRASMRVAPRVA